MLAYVLGGAAIGAVIGYLVPPSFLFWFILGAISGCAAQRYINRRY